MLTSPRPLSTVAIRLQKKIKKKVGVNNSFITLSQDNPNDFPLAILGCYKDCRSIANTRNMCCSDGFLEVESKYLGGLWVLFDFTSLWRNASYGWKLKVFPLEHGIMILSIKYAANGEKYSLWMTLGDKNIVENNLASVADIMDDIENVQIRWIVVYAPQNLLSKISLWSSLTNLMVNWDGILVMMGDFNEV
ncbi:hypothetical protein Tco_0905595 [Tanacetum coccineum]